jgi:hypothetical protein
MVWFLLGCNSRKQLPTLLEYSEENSWNILSFEFELRTQVQSPFQERKLTPLDCLLPPNLSPILVAHKIAILQIEMPDFNTKKLKVALQGNKDAVPLPTESVEKLGSALKYSLMPTSMSQWLHPFLAILSRLMIK